MAKKKRSTNRYNIFQGVLSKYLQDSGIPKTDYKKYKGIYKELDKSIPPKRFEEYIAVIVKKLQGPEKETIPTNYGTGFPFYNAKAEFSLPKYRNILLKVKFNDGGLKIDWKGSQTDFMQWFSGDIMYYFRNNYNDSSNMAVFEIKKADDTFAEYEIQVPGSMYGTPGWIEPGSDISPRKPQGVLPGVTPAGPGVKSVEEQKIDQDDKRFLIQLEQEKQKTMELQLKLIKEYRELGFTNEEIRKLLNK